MEKDMIQLAEKCGKKTGDLFLLCFVLFVPTLICVVTLL
jgi:hypothetical protein